ncbi:YdcF family protein [Sporosarcina sp. Sa2YVA2]|uniref:YdcF family protein n=2 Tax=Sporosarcina quadrami TaxID=2762234 RepID=A0ABR8U8X4_9BACL|nr:YdcF family protein [Sporosarcina quadrami]
MLLGLIVIILVSVIWMMSGKWITDGQKPTADGSNAYAIILGAKVNGEVPSLSLRYRLETAIAYAEKYPDVMFILSGGQGPDEDISEAEAMRRYLTDHGVDEERLLMESESTSTYENIRNSKKLMPEGINEITIITSDYHLARARFIAKNLDLQSDALPAKTPSSVKAKQHIRERLAIIKTKLVGK